LKEKGVMDYSKVFDTNSIYIYGYGDCGRNVYKKILLAYPEKVKGVVVTKYNRKTLSDKEKGALIHEISELRNIDNRTLFILATNKKYHKEIQQTLKEKDFSNYIEYNESMDSFLNNNIKETPKLETRFLGVSVGQACNYKCRDCANFAPYAKPENLRYSLNEIKMDIDRTMVYFERVDKFHIQGGEPFVYTELGELITYIANNYSDIIRSVQIGTNGSILPSNELLDIISKYGVTVRISNYKREENHSRLIDKLKERNIKYKIYNFAGKKTKWNYLGGGRTAKCW